MGDKKGLLRHSLAGPGPEQVGVGDAGGEDGKEEPAERGRGRVFPPLWFTEKGNWVFPGRGGETSGEPEFLFMVRASLGQAEVPEA